MASHTCVPGALEIQLLPSPSPPAPPGQLPLINPGQPRPGPMPLPALPKTCPTSRGRHLTNPDAQLREAGKLEGQPLASTLFRLSKLEGDAQHSCYS